MQDFLFVKNGKKYSKLFFSEIVYIESFKNYIQIVTAKNKYMIKVTMSRVEKAFPKNQFCRIHRCYIVALNSIIDFTNDNIHIQGRHLPFGGQYRKVLLDRIITLEYESGTTTSGDVDNILNKLGLN